MDVLYAHCAGLDVHKKTVVVCRLGVDAKGHKTKLVETFGTMTAELLRLSDWLTAGSCTHVATPAPPSGAGGEHRGVLETDLEPVGRQL